MIGRAPKWPFGPSDGGPLSRPKVVDMENVLIAIVADAAEAERAMAALEEFGIPADHLRRYSSEQILEYDRLFQESRGLSGRLVGTVVDDRESMGQYVDFARAGHAALWVLTQDREQANRVMQLLADHDVVFIWYHGPGGVESVKVR
jgi:hypothetical protein